MKGIVTDCIRKTKEDKNRQSHQLSRVGGVKYQFGFQQTVQFLKAKTLIGKEPKSGFFKNPTEKSRCLYRRVFLCVFRHQTNQMPHC